MAELDLLLLPTTPTSCASTSRRASPRRTPRRRPDRAAAPADDPAAVDLVLGAPRACSRSRAGGCAWSALATQARCLVVVGAWVMSTDELDALAAKVLRVHPLAQVSTDEPRGRA